MKKETVKEQEPVEKKQAVAINDDALNNVSGGVVRIIVTETDAAAENKTASEPLAPVGAIVEMQ